MTEAQKTAVTIILVIGWLTFIVASLILGGGGAALMAVALVLISLGLLGWAREQFDKLATHRERQAP